MTIFSFRKARLAIGACLLLAAGQANAQSTGFGVLRATINGNGVVLDSNGVISAVRPVVGRVDVKFARPVDVGCTAVVAPFGALVTQLTSAPKAATPDTIQVRTFDAAGVAASRSFSIIVTCGP